MGERPRTYADRLPPLVPKEETDISHLSDEMADILYPGRRPRPFRMGVVFRDFEGPDRARALDLARRSPVYRTEQRGQELFHWAEFEPSEARTLRELFGLVGQRADSEVRIDQKRWPYGYELWLPLFWFFVGGEG